MIGRNGSPYKSRKYQRRLRCIPDVLLIPFCASGDFPLYAKRSMAAVTMAMGAELSGLSVRLRYQQNLKSVIQINHLKYCSFSILVIRLFVMKVRQFPGFLISDAVPAVAVDNAYRLPAENSKPVFRKR
jgi:hypothetical protein